MEEIIQKIAVIFPTFMLALVFHEYGHAWMAKRYGDETALWSGRLTLNPAAHVDLMGTIIFPLMSMILGSSIFFGWAKPVPINPRLFTNYRKGLFWVSLAGPLANILLGFVVAILLVLFITFVPQNFVFYTAFGNMGRFMITINFSLAIFNLIPLPPLDGAKILESFLDYNSARKLESIQQYSFFILMGLIFTGALQIISYPILFLDQFALGTASAIVRMVIG